MNVRPKHLLAVLALGLVVISLQARSGAADPNLPAPRPVPSARTAQASPAQSKQAVIQNGVGVRLEPAVVKGEKPEPDGKIREIGPTEEQARNLACNIAWERMVGYLEKLNPPSRWKPTEELLNSPRFYFTFEPEDPRNPNGQGKFRGKIERMPDGKYECELDLIMYNDLYKEILAQDRRLEAEERQTQGGWILGGVLALVLVVGGYFYLEDTTRGYYTLVLRLTALAAIVATAVGLWFALTQGTTYLP